MSEHYCFAPRIQRTPEEKQLQRQKLPKIKELSNKLNDLYFYDWDNHNINIKTLCEKKAIIKGKNSMLYVNSRICDFCHLCLNQAQHD
jgi:Na+-translocating ferredoxin:NAD+ oxidoreductase RNF subunit RnfB